jgi:hypothetical protein
MNKEFANKAATEIKAFLWVCEALNHGDLNRLTMSKTTEPVNVYRFGEHQSRTRIWNID